MDATQLIEKCQEFLDLYCKEKIIKLESSGEESLEIDFMQLVKYDIDISDMLLETPEEIIKAFELALKQFEVSKKIFIRFNNFPESNAVMIRNIRSKHLNKLLVLNGVVRQKGEVRPLVTSAKYECPSCGNIITEIQKDNKFREPEKCHSCGRKGKFKLIQKNMVDSQVLVLEEIAEQLESGQQPKRMNIILKNDLVSPLSEKKTNPGNNVLVTGILKEVEKIDRQGAKSTLYDLIIEGNYVESMQQDFTQIEITPEEEQQIIEISKSKEYKEMLVKSLVPAIHGYDQEKLALLLQMFGGVQRDSKSGTKSRGSIHLLLIGDPGAGKSQMLKRAAKIAPKAQFVSGKSASGAGLTATVVKDDVMGGWALEAGAMVLAHKGQVMIDELDKMSDEDRSAMHEALEQQQISIAKANIRATLSCETTVLAAANPKFGRFDPYEKIPKQIDLPSTLINRFDLIFPVRDLPNEARDRLISSKILKVRSVGIDDEAPIDTDLLRKYIAYSKQNCFPVMSDEAISVIQEFYVKMRNQNGDDGAMASIPINARYLEGFVRLTEASAKMRLSQNATGTDAKQAIELVMYSLSQIGIDPETGNIDVDKLETGITTSQRNKIIMVRQVINDLAEKLGNMIPIDDIIEGCRDIKIAEDVVDECIEKLKRKGDIFEPKKGFISKI